MKRFVLFWNSLIVMGLLASACASPQAVAPAPVPPTPVPPTPVPPFPPLITVPKKPNAGALAQDRQKYIFLAANNADPFYVPGLAGWNDAGKMLGVKVEFAGPLDMDVAEHFKQFAALNAQEDTAGIFWYPVDFQAGGPLIQESLDKGISLVIGAADSPLPIRDAFIGYDQTMLGSAAAQLAAEALKGRTGKVRIGVPESGRQIQLTERVVGMKDLLPKLLPDLEIEWVMATMVEESVDGVIKALRAFITAQPDLDLFWFPGGQSGSFGGMIEELRAAGNKTIWLGTDMPPVMLDAIQKGLIYGSIGQDTYTEEFWGLMLNYFKYNGYRVPDKVYLRAITITKDNVDEFIGE